jgi:hypothetical protein
VRIFVFSYLVSSKAIISSSGERTRFSCAHSVLRRSPAARLRVQCVRGKASKGRPAGFAGGSRGGPRSAAPGNFRPGTSAPRPPPRGSRGRLFSRVLLPSQRSEYHADIIIQLCKSAAQNFSVRGDLFLSLGTKIKLKIFCCYFFLSRCIFFSLDFIFLPAHRSSRETATLEFVLPDFPTRVAINIISGVDPHAEGHWI